MIASTKNRTSPRASIVDWAVCAGGAVLVATGTLLPRTLGILAAAAGGALIYRGARGLRAQYVAQSSAHPATEQESLRQRCVDASDQPPPTDAVALDPTEQSNAVDEASLESFPASDPPASHQITR